MSNDHDMKILAIDLGKRSAVFCDYRVPDARTVYGTVKMTAAAIGELLRERAPDRLVIEIGPAAGWIHDLATAMGLEVEVANTNHEAWRWKHTKRKTDRRDALRLAQLSSMHQLPTVYIPSAAVRQWRSLIAYRRTLVKRRTRIKNTIRAILDRQGLSMPTGKSGWTKKSLACLRELATVDDGALWRLMLETELDLLTTLEEKVRTIERRLAKIARQDACVQRLKQVPSVGDCLAEAIVAIIDDPHRFRRGRDVGCYVGMTPRQFQSGSIDRSGRISGAGNAMLRSLLVEVAWIGVKKLKVPWMVEVYERVRRGSERRKKTAIVAVARRLLIRCWAILRDQMPWRIPQAARLKLAA
jgi:transposase